MTYATLAFSTLVVLAGLMALGPVLVDLIPWNAGARSMRYILNKTNLNKENEQ